MPAFALLDLEDVVQVGDKTRLNASKSFVTKGEHALIALTIKPGNDQTAVSVFDSADSSAQYLDWVFTDNYFDVDSLRNKLYFSVNGTEYTATVASSSYTFTTLAAAIKTAMNAAGLGTVFDVVYSAQTKVMTFSASFKFVLQGFKVGAELLPSINVIEDTDADTSIETGVLEFGVKTVTVVATAVLVTQVSTKTYAIKVISEADDGLFSSDGDLIAEEADILSWVSPGRATFKNVHRAVQNHIIDWCDQQGYTDVNGDKFTKAAFVRKDDIALWARYDALTKIYQGIQNSKDDVFKNKSKTYEALALAARNRMIIRLDVDGDKKVDLGSSPASWSGSVLRR